MDYQISAIVLKLAKSDLYTKWLNRFEKKVEVISEATAPSPTSEWKASQRGGISVRIYNATFSNVRSLLRNVVWYAGPPSACLQFYISEIVL